VAPLRWLGWVALLFRSEQIWDLRTTRRIMMNEGCRSIADTAARGEPDGNEQQSIWDIGRALGDLRRGDDCSRGVDDSVRPDANRDVGGDHQPGSESVCVDGCISFVSGSDSGDGVYLGAVFAAGGLRTDERGGIGEENGVDCRGVWDAGDSAGGDAWRVHGCHFVSNRHGGAGVEHR
jgi:hypothetical protein